MYTVRQNAVWIGETPVCVVFGEFTPEMIANALNKEVYTYKAAPQFQPWDIVRVGSAEGIVITGPDYEGEYKVFFVDHDDFHHVPIGQIELVERLADRKAQG